MISQHNKVEEQKKTNENPDAGKDKPQNEDPKSTTANEQPKDTQQNTQNNPK